MAITEVHDDQHRPRAREGITGTNTQSNGSRREVSDVWGVPDEADARRKAHLPVPDGEDVEGGGGDGDGEGGVVTALIKCQEPIKGGGVCGAYHHPREDGVKRCDLHRPKEPKAVPHKPKEPDAA